MSKIRVFVLFQTENNKIRFIFKLCVWFFQAGKYKSLEGQGKLLEEIGQPKDIHYLNAIKYRKEGGEGKWNTKYRKKGFKVEIGKRFRGCVRF